MRATIPQVMRYMALCPVSVGPQLTLAEAEERMSDFGIRHLAVQEEGSLVGVISERDVQFVRAMAHANPRRLTVGEVMSPPFRVRPDAPLDQVVREMIARKLGSAMVVADGKLVGVFTVDDALVALRDALTIISRPPLPSPPRPPVRRPAAPRKL